MRSALVLALAAAFAGCSSTADDPPTPPAADAGATPARDAQIADATRALDDAATPADGSDPLRDASDPIGDASDPLDDAATSDDAATFDDAAAPVPQIVRVTVTPTV